MLPTDSGGGGGCSSCGGGGGGEIPEPGTLNPVVGPSAPGGGGPRGEPGGCPKKLTVEFFDTCIGKLIRVKDMCSCNVFSLPQSFPWSIGLGNGST